MSVFNRKLFFNRGGQVSARGTGITDGLIDTPKRGYVDRPGSYASEDDADATLPTTTKFKADPFEDIFARKQGILENLRPPTQEFSKFNAAAPALMTFFGNLMSGKSFQSGFSGAFDIAGNALTQATPQFSEALAARRAAEAADRKEKFALDLQAYDSAETAHVAQLAREAKELEVNYKDKLDTVMKNGRQYTQPRVSLDGGATWSNDGVAYPANMPSMVAGSNGIYLDANKNKFEGYQQTIEGKLVTKRADNDKVVIGGTSTKIKEYELGEKIYSLINNDTGKFNGFQFDMSTDEGLEIYNKVLKQKEGDTVLIDGEEVPVKDLNLTADSPQIVSEETLGDNLLSVIGTNGKATGEQIDLATSEGMTRYLEILKDKTLTVTKVGVTAATTEVLTSGLSQGTIDKLQISKMDQIDLVADLLPVYQSTLRKDFINPDTFVGATFNWANNRAADIRELAKVFASGESEEPIFFDDDGEALSLGEGKFLEQFQLDEDRKNLLQQVAGEGQLFNSRKIGLAYSIAIANNPDGRISNPDFEYALRQLVGGTNDSVIMGNIMLDLYAKSKRRYKNKWYLQNSSGFEAGTNGTVTVDDGKGGTIQKTWQDQAEEDFFALSKEAEAFEEILKVKDGQNNTKKSEKIKTEQSLYPLPFIWNGKKLIEKGKPAESFIFEWLNSDIGNNETLYDMILKQNGVVILTYEDENNNKRTWEVTLED